jgi:hypothetical protein
MADQMLLIQEEPRGPSQLIEIPVAGNLTKIVIPVIQQLQNNTNQIIIIKALRLITVDVLTNAPTVGGVNAPITELQKMSIVIYSEGWEKGQLIPVLSLNDMFIEGTGTPFRPRTTKFDNWQNVDWNKSFLQFANGTVPVGAPYNVIFEAEYVRLNKDNKVIVGPA